MNASAIMDLHYKWYLQILSQFNKPLGENIIKELFLRLTKSFMIRNVDYIPTSEVHELIHVHVAMLCWQNHKAKTVMYIIVANNFINAREALIKN